jgi:hypothetical protein
VANVEVTSTEAVFKIEIRDASNGSVIGKADYEGVLIAQPYSYKLVN